MPDVDSAIVAGIGLLQAPDRIGAADGAEWFDKGRGVAILTNSYQCYSCREVGYWARVLQDWSVERQLSLAIAVPEGDSGRVDSYLRKERVQAGLVVVTGDLGRMLAAELDVRGTPTIFVNGWRVRPDSVGAVVDSVAVHARPYGGYTVRHLTFGSPQ